MNGKRYGTVLEYIVYTVVQVTVEYSSDEYFTRFSFVAILLRSPNHHHHNLLLTVSVRHLVRRLIRLLDSDELQYASFLADHKATPSAPLGISCSMQRPQSPALRR